MTRLDAAAIADIANRHPDLFRRSIWKRYGSLVMVAAALLYGLYCWWFFSIGQVLGSASWNIAGAYLADWVSWEARPEVEIEPDGAMKITFPRFSPLGEHPDPDWIVAERKMRTRQIGVSPAAVPGTADKGTNSFMAPGKAFAPSTPQPATGFMAPGAPIAGGEQTAGKPQEEVSEEIVTHAAITVTDGSEIDVTPVRVEVIHAGERLSVDIDPRGKTISVQGDLPIWATQRNPQERIRISFGFAGSAEIDYDGVKVKRRFLGWENFIFDTHSPFWGRSAGEVWSLIFSAERIDPARSNLSLAWNNILYNAEWQHLDVWTKLLQTIVMAFVGTLFAMLIAFPLSFIAARNITRSGIVNQIAKRFFDFQRSVDMLIWALFFTRAFGPGPLAGISAIFFTDTGTLGKLYSEALENIDDKQREGVRSVGAAPVMVQRYGVLPQVLPIFASQALYFWESNTRSATIIGAVGAGGIGLKLWEAMRTNQDWENVAYMVILILIVVFVFDNISNALRSRLMGTPR